MRLVSIGKQHAILVEPGTDEFEVLLEVGAEVDGKSYIRGEFLLTFVTS